MAPIEARRIVVCVDGSELGERALPHARALAKSCGLSLTLLTVLESGRGGAAPQDPIEWEVRRREVRHYLSRLAGSHQAEDLVVDLEVIEGEVAAEICAWDWRHDVGITALSTHGASGTSPWSLASTARKLVEGAPGSLLLVPCSAEASDEVARYRHLVVPLDGSRRGETVLPLATQIASANHAELTLVHVVPVSELMEIGPLDARDLELRDRLTRRNERIAGTYLDRVRARLAASHLAIRIRVLRATDPRNRLAAFLTDQEADLVVLSAHGRSERLDMPVGSVAEHLIHRARQPLLIVRPRSASQPKGMPSHVENTRLPSHAAP